jgi:hypothetical protein
MPGREAGRAVIPLRRSLVAAMLALFGVLGFWTTCGATSWLPPLRPLTDQERAELRVSASHAIVVGRVVAVHGCAEVVVDSVIVGTLPSGPIHVHTLWGGFDSFPHVLLMLRPDGSGGYESVGFGGGTLTLKGDRVEALGMSVHDFVGRIRHATAAHGAKRAKP